MSFFSPRRPLLLAVALLSACGAAGSPTTAPARTPAEPAGVFGPYLSGRFAQSETDTRIAADNMLDALRRDPTSSELVTRAFLASLLDGRAEAQRLARQLPDNQACLLYTSPSPRDRG